MTNQLELNAAHTSNQTHEISLVGAWQGEISVSNHEDIPGFATLFTFHQGGTTSETHPLFTPNNKLGFGPLQATPGQGIWRKAGEGHYEATFALLIQGAAGHPALEGQLIGINKIHYKLQLNDNGNQLTGQWNSCLRTPQSDVIVEGQGEYTAQRIEFDISAEAIEETNSRVTEAC